MKEKTLGADAAADGNNTTGASDQLTHAAPTFTPGPWKVEGVVDDCAIVNRDHDGEHWDVAIVHHVSNAHLIAAAPELLAAAKAFVGKDNPPAGAPGHIDFNEAIGMLHRAIARAEGR